jgi:hypothetical protein
MSDNFAKYVLAFLAVVYLMSCVAEIWMVKDGAEAVFESVEKIVPHIGMFILGLTFAKNKA